MWSENSDKDIYITQSTFREESNLDDVDDWFQDGSPTDGQVLKGNGNIFFLFKIKVYLEAN